MRTLLLLISIVLLVSCAETNYQDQMIQHWQGKRSEALLRNWGTPELQTYTPEGHTLYVYTTSSFRPTTPPTGSPYTISVPRIGRPVITTVQTSTDYGLSQLKCETIFEANKQGYIINAKIEGNNCQEDPKFLKRMSETS